MKITIPQEWIMRKAREELASGASIEAGDPAFAPMKKHVLLPDPVVWFAEAPDLPGYYLAAEPQRMGKLGEQTELGTWSWELASQFSSKEECEAWIAANPSPRWVATAHIITPYKTQETKAP